MSDKQEGPKLYLTGRCTGCKYLSSDQDDYDDRWYHSCTHKDIHDKVRYMSYRHIGYSANTPDWCPLLAIAQADFISKLQYKYCENI